MKGMASAEKEDEGNGVCREGRVLWSEVELGRNFLFSDFILSDAPKWQNSTPIYSSLNRLPAAGGRSNDLLHAGVCCNNLEQLPTA